MYFHKHRAVNFRTLLNAHLTYLSYWHDNRIPLRWYILKYYEHERLRDVLKDSRFTLRLRMCVHQSASECFSLKGEKRA